jgi:hypothetical protein
MSNERELDPREFDRLDRREACRAALRLAALGAVAGVSGVVLLRGGGSGAGDDCLLRIACRDCRALRDCRLPRARAARRRDAGR